MSNPNDVRVVACEVTFEPVPFRAPLKFGGRVVDRTDLINAAVTVERRDGKTATGHGSMPVGNVWAWPSEVTDAATAERAMKRLAEVAAAEMVDSTTSWYGPGSAISLGADFLSERVQEKHVRTVVAELELSEEIPPLARLVSVSPIDAALHDAYGRVHDASSFDVLGPEFSNDDLSIHLDGRFAGEYLDRYTLRSPKPAMPLYHLVGALDPLTDEDVDEPIGDGLPETLPEWIAADGLTHFKNQAGRRRSRLGREPRPADRARCRRGKSGLRERDGDRQRPGTLQASGTLRPETLPGSTPATSTRSAGMRRTSSTSSTG